MQGIWLGFGATTATLLAEPVGKEWSEAGFPLADRLVRDGEATEEEQLRDVTEAELVAEAPEEGVEDDVGPHFRFRSSFGAPQVYRPPSNLTQPTSRDLL
jgi:hypothetical protein